jgi:prevent-host-death family protein
MQKLGAYEAKTHLPKLLERVQQGERFLITKHGKPVAELVPVGDRDMDTTRNAVADLHALKAELRGRGIRCRDLLEDSQSLRDLAHIDHER